MDSRKLRTTRSSLRSRRRTISSMPSCSSSSSAHHNSHGPSSPSATPTLSSAIPTTATGKSISHPTPSKNTHDTDEQQKSTKTTCTSKYVGNNANQPTSPQPHGGKNDGQGEVFDRHDDYIQDLTLQLSAKESRRQIKRSALDGCFEEFQQIRNKMKALQEELLTLDDEIELLEKRRARAGVMTENGDDDDDDAVNTQYAMNMNQLDTDSQSDRCLGAESREDKGRTDRVPQDLSSRQEPRRKQISATAPTTAQTPNSLLSVNSDELINEPCKDRGYHGQMKNTHDEDEAAAIEDYYADDPPPSYDPPQQHLLEEYNYYIPEEDESNNNEIINNSVQSDRYISSRADSKPSCQSKRGNMTTDSFTPTLSFSTIKAAPPAGLVRTSSSEVSSQWQENDTSSYSTSTKCIPNGPTATIDQYFIKPVQSTSSSTNKPPSSASASLSIFPPSLQQRYNIMDDNNSNRKSLPGCTRYNSENSKASYPKDMCSEDFPWSKHLKEQLHNTFKIRTFRDHQKEIINCTMSGEDVFVIMRTGGGKSLTYQLPALLEGLSPARKLTLVISPLLSLIRDQEDQMNSFYSDSAISFTSGMVGGATERARRWNLVRNPDSGLCIIFVTPEMVHKSNKLRSELEKLNDQGRLGRFVIDECHCACQWGHDFRPDYTKLGILKQHFPQIPLIAVTATASDRVRVDCCRILKIGSPKFFRSSANRPNLRYSVRVKVDKPDRVVEDMANFIKEHHPHNAGIVYAFSRKEADTIADKLNNFGISARAYHSSVCDSAKESIHRNWMQNKTQIVVATIAFGLGINKPDVRFVIHHTLSKSLEAYYQESGRAGRDGGAADCVLYYSVKDVSRMIGMIHGENGEGSFWSIVRYSQQHGDDALCRRIILSTLGEPGCASIEQVLSQGISSNTTEEKEVGKHAKTLVRLIQNSPKDLTIQQLVTKWRGNDVPDFVKETPPGPDLNKDECERLIAALLLSDILYPKVVFTAYASIVYIGLRNNAALLVSSPNPKVAVRFPIREPSIAKTAKNDAHRAIQDENGWLSKKKSSAKKTPKKTVKKKETKTASTRKTSKTGNTKTSESRKKGRSTPQGPEVINIDDSDDEAPRRRKRLSRNSTSIRPKRIKTDIDIFEDSCSESEYE